MFSCLSPECFGSTGWRKFRKILYIVLCSHHIFSLALSSDLWWTVKYVQIILTNVNAALFIVTKSKLRKYKGLCGWMVMSAVWHVFLLKSFLKSFFFSLRLIPPASRGHETLFLLPILCKMSQQKPKADCAFAPHPRDFLALPIHQEQIWDVCNHINGSSPATFPVSTKRDHHARNTR